MTRARRPPTAPEPLPGEDVMAPDWRTRVQAHLARTERTGRMLGRNARGDERSIYLRKQDRARRAAMAELINHHPREWDLALTFAKQTVGLIVPESFDTATPEEAAETTSPG